MGRIIGDPDDFAAMSGPPVLQGLDHGGGSDLGLANRIVRRVTAAGVTAMMS